MSDDRRQHADAIFQRALDLPSGEREAFVRHVCSDDAVLRDEVLTMLRNDPGTDDTFAAPVRLGPKGRFVTDPERVGPYKILERLGEGAFGVVYEVEQTEPIRRHLALKLLKPGMDTEHVLARFEAERQALARMDHPNIARVVDAGATEQGRPYFVMELVKGDPIALYCDRERLDVDARIDLFLDVCRAVQHAHQRGILHRDLKPSNVLVTRVDGRAVVKVIDFGIAKALTTPLVERTLHTVAGEIMGTPAYMSPEQSDRTGVDIDTASDVFSLGVMLYELLCGRLPVDPDARTEMRRTRRLPPSQRFDDDEDAIRRAWWRNSDPWEMRSRLRADLDWIVMRAIARDRSRRYQTALELVEELQRYRRHEAVLAGPPTLAYRTRKFVRRHWVGLGFAATVLLGLIGMGAGLTWALIRSNEQRAQIESARAESEAVLGFLTNMLASVRPSDLGNDPSVREVIDRSARDLGHEFGDRPLVEARLRQVVGVSYRELGRYDDAQLHLERAEALLREYAGELSWPHVTALREIAVLERSKGNYAEAESLFVRVVDANRSRDDATPYRLAGALNDLGGLYLMASRDSSAVPVLEEALVLAEPVAAPDDSLMAHLLSDLGIGYQALGRFDDAERALLRAKAIERARHGAGHPYARWSGINLAGFYRETGRLEQALAYYQDAYDAALTMFGEDNPSTVRTLSNMALVLSDLGRLDEALGPTVDVVRIRERTMGEDNPGTLASRLNLTLLQLRRGEFDQALVSIDETLRRCARVFDPDHLYVVIGLGHRARALRGMGRTDEALATAVESVERGRRALPEGHWRIGIALCGQASCLIDLDRTDEAEPLLRQAVSILEGQLGADHAHTQSAYEELVRLHERRGDREAAREWTTRLVAKN